MPDIIAAAPIHSRRRTERRASLQGYVLRCTLFLTGMVGLFHLAGFFG